MIRFPLRSDFLFDFTLSHCPPSPTILTVRDKAENDEYASLTEMVADFRLMLENCYRYNGPDHFISKRGQRLEQVFEQKLSLLAK